MKTDTEYFHLACDAWCKKERWRKDLPLTMAAISEVLRDAQALKSVDRARIDDEGTQA